LLLKMNLNLIIKIEREAESGQKSKGGKRTWIRNVSKKYLWLS